MFEDNKLKHRFEWTEQGLTSFATYSEHDGVVFIPHVESPIELRGKGAAGRLMDAIAAHAREANLRLRPTCPYAVYWFKRHPDAADVLA